MGSEMCIRDSANLRHFFRKNGGRGFRIWVSLGVDIIQGLENRFFRDFGGGGGVGGWGVNLRGYNSKQRIIIKLL